MRAGKGTQLAGVWDIAGLSALSRIEDLLGGKGLWYVLVAVPTAQS